MMHSYTPVSFLLGVGAGIALGMVFQSLVFGVVFGIAFAVIFNIAFKQIATPSQPREGASE